MPYDDAEARDLLAKDAEERQPDKAGRAKAAQALLDALVELNGAAGFTIQRIDSGGTVVMHYGHRVIHIGALRDGEVVMTDPYGLKPTEIEGLEFDRLTGELVGTQPDTFHGLPVPGEPTRHQSALAVVVKAALNALRE